ncbi:glycoside hydrolase [Ethanoligenens harbinense]|nr:glycoside hydrolase [Ethanoligenens harbinense YUAN-3]AYF40110.1 glycoside hydrolase [Ethanoligenens harbinense]AYF42950.1 glycoside hydrolase [Ethanoligenens harbinense]QCN93708.1 glycoside hydrolase [Ethanoligenens harbinense]
MLLVPFQASADSISDWKQQYASLQQQLQQVQGKLNAQSSQLKTEKAKQAALNQEVSIIQGQLAVLRQQIENVNAQIANKEDEIQTTEQRVQQNTELLKQRLRALYMSGDDTFLTVLLNSNDISDFLTRVAVVRAVSDHDNEIIQSLKQDESQLKADRTALDQSKQSLLQVQGAAAAKQDILNAQLAQQAQVVAQVQAGSQSLQQQANSLNAQASQTNDQINAAVAAQAAATQLTATATASNTMQLTGAALGNATALVSYAEQFVGCSYVMNAAGPTSFDCSGLVMYVYQHAAHIGLPHSAAGQAGYGTAVSKSALQPGDLVFFHVSGGSIDHVGIYVGGGQMVNAEKPGVGVVTDNINSGYWASKFDCARRILN